MLILIFVLVNIEFQLRNSLQILKKLTEQVQQNFFCQRSESRYFRLSKPYSFYYN